MQKRDKYDHLDITGMRYGRLTAIKKVGKSKWLLHCDCGNDVILKYSRLLGGQKSCGCLRKECGQKFVESHITHGGTHTKLYRKYRSILDRCYNENSSHYPRYGGRGITVCDEWKESFSEFRDWAYKNGYDPEKNGYYWSIDRIDNSKGYSPSNCRFATAQEQMRNRDITTLYNFNGKEYSASEFADKFGVSKSFVYLRIKNKGQTLEEILSDWNRKQNIPRGYIDLAAYAKLHNVTVHTVNRWIKKGKIKAEKFGIKWYVDTN